MATDLMDAKAKVVAWQWQASGGVWLPCTEETVHEYSRFFPVRALVLESDHEAALAGLVEENAASEAICWRKCDELDARLQSLLTSLEALAGEWDEDAAEDRENGHLNPGGPSDLFARLLRARIATLTNSAKGNGDGN